MATEDVIEIFEDNIDQEDFDWREDDETQDRLQEWISSLSKSTVLKGTKSPIGNRMSNLEGFVSGRGSDAFKDSAKRQEWKDEQINVVDTAKNRFSARSKRRALDDALFQAIKEKIPESVRNEIRQAYEDRIIEVAIESKSLISLIRRRAISAGDDGSLRELEQLRSEAEELPEGANRDSLIRGIDALRDEVRNR